MLYIVDYNGCFVKPSNIEPIFSNYSSMDLTFCKQLCMKNGSKKIMVDEASCSCINSTDELTSVVNQQCFQPCPGNRLQICGGKGVVNIYDNGK